jgi:SAM-dependent methyltransferase
MIQKLPNHYNSKYFLWQKNIGNFGGEANKFKFIKDINRKTVVCDFGCGGGYLLNNLDCKEKIGIEPNAVARIVAKKMGIKKIYANINECLKYHKYKIDLIISNHALEHTTSPLQEIKNLKSLLVKGGRVHFVVPCENISYLYNPAKDKNYHLYSWSPMTLGNLFNEAGYRVIFSRPLIHKWPPYYKFISKFGPNLFNFVCRIYGHLARDWFQVEVLAEKK